jgi:PAT family beta-lactamase induction signal transducer AmpG
VVDAWGYPTLFTTTAAIGIPLIVLCFVVRRDTVAAQARGEETAANGMPVAAASRS